MANMQELLSQRFEAQRQKLISMDIVAVAESLGMTLKPGSSGIYYWEEHDSFHIYPNTNTFRWWSRGVGTNTIDLVQVVQEEMTGHKPTFREATSFLETGQFNNVTVQPVVKEPFEYYLERYEHPDFNIGRQYLKEERGLSDETIDTFLASGNLATATRKKGDYFEPVIVFKSRDNDGKMIGASLQGIVENRVQHPERGRLKQIMKNSDGTAGFSLDIGNPKRLVFAEAPIDLMSYYELHKDELQDVKLVAMDGLKKSVISRYVADMLTDGKYSQTMSTEQIRGALDALNKTTNILQEHPDMITLAVDNDSSGRDFVENLIKDGIPVIADLPPKSENQPKMDWNDYLKQRKKEAKPMENHAIKKPNKDQLALFDNLVDLSPKKDKKEKQTPAALTSYGSFRIDDEFLERRYGTQPREDAITTVLNALKNNLSLESIGVDNDPTEYAFVSTVDVEGYQLDLAVYSHTPELEPHGRYDWSLLVLEKTEPVGFLAYGEDWFKEQANLKEKLTDLQTWINQKSVKKHLLTQQAYNHFLESLDEKTQEVTSISYEDYKQETKDFEESVKQKIAAGKLSLNVDDDVYAYMVFRSLGNSHPMKTVTDKRLTTLHSTDIIKQLKAVTDENVDAYKTKGTPEQDKLYQSFKANQRQLGLSNVSTQFVGEMAIGAYNINHRLSALSQEQYHHNTVSMLSGMVRDVIEYPCMENGNDGLSIFIHSENALYSYLDKLSGDVTLTREDLDKLIDTISNHSPEVIWEENKKSLEETQEAVNSDSMKKTLSQNQESNTGGERFNRNSSSLGDDSPGTAPKPVEYETQPNFPTNVPFHFSIDRSKKSTVKLRDGYTYATDKKIRQLNLFADDIKKSANWYLDNISDSQITYFYQDGNFVSSLRVQFEKKNWMHLTGIAPVYSNWVDSLSEQFIDDVARGHGEFANLSLGRGVMEKIQILPMLPEVLETDSFVFDDLSSVQKFQRFDAKRAIRTDNEQLVLAFKMKDDTLHPATLLKPSKKLNIVLDELNQEKTILGVIIEKDGKVNVHRVNEDYVKDGGLEMKSIVENKQFEEVKVTKTDVTAKKQKAKDSDGDGLTDDEEIALGTNPYSPDTDGDGVIDSIERGSGTDATNPSDTPANRQKEQMKHNLALSEMIKAKDTAALNQHLQEGIKDYFDSDTYKNYLEGMAHFNHYSPRNIQLIKAQLPEATMVASFEEWKKRNGHVNKGEKALYVQAPVTVIKKDADGKPVINADTGEKETLTYFKPVPVFDISQISPQQGKQLNLPKSSETIPARLNKDYYQNVYRALRDISQKENGIPIRFRELEQSDGFYNPKTNDITIKKGMTYEQTLSTLIHEMAHSELHNNQSLAEHFKGKLTRSSEELQAESVAYVVSNHLGFDTSKNSFAYLASWSQEADGLENLKAQLEIVQEEASSLMKRIDKHLARYQNLTVSKDDTLTETQKRHLEKSANPFYQSL